MPIMLIDDNEDIRDALGMLLKTHGYDVRPFAGGAEALTELRAGYLPSLIVLDLSMPSMDGYAFRREQLSAPNLAQIPVIVLSGVGQHEMDIARLGAVAFLTKPVDPALLLTMVRAHRVPLLRPKSE